MKRSFREFLADETGAATVEMVVIFLPLMVLVLTIFEIGIAYHFTLTAQKSAQIGARYIATRDPIHNNLPSSNVIHYRYGAFGDSCYQGASVGTDACLDPGGPWICDGASFGPDCNVAGFGELMVEMHRVYPSVEPADVSVGYYYRRLGYAGGPMVPEIRVTIKPRPSPLQLLSFLDIFASDEGYAVADEEDWDTLTLRSVSASAFGEDLNSTH